ncbi:acyltransferase family protein [Pseudomonas sp.]|uniref:acyltransferase family protein n=1 Tax=Pseudomonas sp. TaxID=306 RepID=UPI0031E32021
MSKNQENSNKRNFRLDINGLRAWAVCIVILYHFGVRGFGGGFVGVDVFFVISGFLMTGIIISGLTKNSEPFSLLQFYLARAKRLIPALAALCIALLMAGWFYLLQTDYLNLAKHVISALGFFSNIQLLSEAGYFDAASYDKWLLHTWSLSVEWQFYVIFPVVLISTWKINPTRRSLLPVLSLLFAISFFLCIKVSLEDKSKAFYLLQTRAWEMLAGGLVYLLIDKLSLSQPCRTVIEFLGLALIAASTFLFDPSSIWPSWRAAIPVAGAILVLAAANQNSIFTGSKPTQWIGDCSYSLYLWHWPVVAALASFELLDNKTAIVIGITLTLVLGRISYLYIEKKTRIALNLLPSRQALATVTLATLTIIGSSLIIKMQEGLPHRNLPERVKDILAQATNKNPRMKECHVEGLTPVPECHYGGDVLGAIVLGDSHSSSIMRSVEKALPSKNLYVLDWSLGSCVTIKNIKMINTTAFRCADFLTYALDRLSTIPEDIPVVILNRTSTYIFGPNEPDRQGEVPIPAFYVTKPYSTRTPEYFNEMREGIINTACEFAKHRPVYMVRPIPEMKIDVPKTMVRRSMIPGKEVDVSISFNEYMERNSFVWEAQNIARDRCGIKILDPTPYICTNGRCIGSQGGLPIYYDDDHLNERGGDLLVPLFKSIFSAQSTVKINETK